MLGSFSAVGMWVIDYPDNSIVCHANRETRGSQDVFVSGAALAVDCDADIGFFPEIYNEDWLFFFDDASNGRLANSSLKATQLCYYPFANPRRAAWQEFGDVLAEGLYALLHLGLGIQDAKHGYWPSFIEARRNFLEEIASRSSNAHQNIQAELLASVQSAQKCLLKIEPDLCERYIQLWRQDLDDWKRRMAGIPEVPSIEVALEDMRLSVPVPESRTAKIVNRRDGAAPNITPGPVEIPRFDTLKGWSKEASPRRLSTTAAGPTPASPPRPELKLVGSSELAEPVGFQNSATGPDLGFYAARPYSLMRSPRTGLALDPFLGEVRGRVVGPGRAKLAATMGSPSVVMGRVLGQDQPQMPFAEDQHPVGEHEAFRKSIRSRAAGRDLHGLDTGAGQERVKRCGELPGPVADQ